MRSLLYYDRYWLRFEVAKMSELEIYQDSRRFMNFRFSPRKTIYDFVILALAPEKYFLIGNQTAPDWLIRALHRKKCWEVDSSRVFIT